MSEKLNTNKVNCDEHLALKNLFNDISKDELEIAKKYIEALEHLNKKSENKPKG
ncbi:hypothetical protein FJQ98_16055 [Lysinibacillus agricola]|uniref:Transcriptional regulator n=1 Tax=Lysinibacillus agricola TaxID=2590012 RepID=A0ABX7AR94_9BACI|nr:MULTISPECIES: hypothetical protein [Lysinibacillus]QQP10759.1 hypothetical protein FJQ98_16055 [Lysinibacillus agricola]